MKEFSGSILPDFLSYEWVYFQIHILHPSLSNVKKATGHILPDSIIHLSDNFTLHRVNCNAVSIPGFMKGVSLSLAIKTMKKWGLISPLFLRGKNLSTASIHLLSVYQPENRAPTSLSLVKMDKTDNRELNDNRHQILTPEVLDNRVNGGKSLAGCGGGQWESWTWSNEIVYNKKPY